MSMDKIEYLRKNIDEIDRNIVRLLVLRFKLIMQIGKYKKEKGIGVVEKKREYEILKNVKFFSDLPYKSFIVGIFKKIINYSRKLQSK